MATFLPPIVYDAPQVTPLAGGLYGAANVVQMTGPSRLVGGLQIVPANCGEHGLLPVDCPQDTDFEGDVPGVTDVFPAVAVYAADECGLMRTDETARARAQHILSLNERQDVERHFAGLLIERVDEVISVTGDKEVDRVAAAVSAAEGALGARGLTGVLHAPASLAVAASRAGVIRWQGSTPFTPLGHRWAFGGGYQSLGSTLYVTGAVTVLRSDVVTYRGLEVRSNSRLMVAQREVVSGWECFDMGVDFGGEG